MDRDLEALESIPTTDGARFALAVLGAVFTMVVAALLIWMFPTEAHRAGYDAAVIKGPTWAEAEIDAAGGTVLRACETLLLEAIGIGDLDYGEFIAGCAAGMDHLSGGHVPTIAAR